MDGRVYVFLRDETVRTRFLKDAQKEGFAFEDGCLPLKRKEVDDIYALNDDRTLNFIGFAGHMAFRCAEEVHGEKLIRIDYERYVAGLEDCIILR